MRIRLLSLIVFSLLVAACAHHEVKVDCGGSLKPINPPAPKEAAETPVPADSGSPK